MGEFRRSDWRSARKPHKCSLCGETIQSGEFYLRCAAKIDGEFYDDCYHEKCAAILEAFCDEYKPHGEFSFDNVEDWLRDQCRDVCKKWQDCHCNIFRCEAIRSIPAIMEVERRNRGARNATD